MPSFTFDPVSGRYRAPDGRYLPETQVRTWLDTVADAASGRLQTLTGRLQNGQMPLAEWQAAMMAELKNLHLASAMAAHGGRDQMSKSDSGYVGSLLKKEYGFMRTWAAQIADGTAPLDGRLPARARQYGQSARATFEQVRARDDRARGFDEERNVLHSADPCRECPALSARGWVAIGELPMPGARSCARNCKCTMKRRRAA